MYKVECNTFLVELSIVVFLMLQHESVFIAVMGLMATKLWKVLIC
jgi:hypothetical protein